MATKKIWQIINWIVLIIIGYTLIFSFHGMVSLGAETITDIRTKIGSNKWSDGAFGECNHLSSEKNKIACVNYYFQQRFEYEENGPFDDLDENFKGDCDSASLFYLETFKKMNLKTYPIIESPKWGLKKNHIFVFVETKEEGNCILDMWDMGCWG